MPGPRGVITVNGDKKIAQECEEGDRAMARAACIAESIPVREPHQSFDDIIEAKRHLPDLRLQITAAREAGKQGLQAIANKDTSQTSRVAISNRNKATKGLHYQAGHSGLKTSSLVST